MPGQITAMNWACFALKNCEEFEKGLDKAQELSGSFAVQFEGGGLWKQHGTESQNTDDFLLGVHEPGGGIPVCFNNGITSKRSLVKCTGILFFSRKSTLHFLTNIVFLLSTGK